MGIVSSTIASSERKREKRQRYPDHHDINDLLLGSSQLSYKDSKLLFRRYTEMRNKQPPLTSYVQVVTIRERVIDHGMIGYYRGRIYAYQLLGRLKPLVIFEYGNPCFEQSIVDMAYYIEQRNARRPCCISLTLVLNNNLEEEFVFDISIIQADIFDIRFVV